MVTPGFLRTRLLPLGLALALVLGVLSVARAATPGSGTITSGSRAASWQGKTYTQAVPDPAACPSKAVDPNDTVCDHYTLTVTVPSGQAANAEVTINWPDAADDFDLYVYKGGALVASAASGNTTSEKAVVAKASGTYEVRVLPFAVTASGYRGTATYRPVAAGGGQVEPGGPDAFRGTRITGALPNREPQNQSAPYSGPPLVLKQSDVGRESAEPTIGVNKQGNAFYASATFDGAAGLADTKVRASFDGGRTWVDRTPPVTDPPVTLDPYVYIEEDSGRLFNLDLTVASSFLNFSDDQGRTYTANPLASGPNVVNDHQTLYAGPKPASSPLVLTDPRFPEIVYYCFNRISDSSCSRSLDGGRTFTNAGIAYPGVQPPGEDGQSGGFCGGLHGHVHTDRAGRVFLPRGYCGKPYVSVSNNAGTTWDRVLVSDAVDMPDNQSAIAADAGGNLYYVWYDSKFKLPFLATSRDHGRSWSKPLMIAPPGVREAQWPTVAAGANGRIAITFPGTKVADEGDLTRPWDYYVLTSTNALAADPLFVSNISNPALDPVHRGDCPGRCGNMLDFLDVLISPAGGNPIWATVVDTCTAESNCRSNPRARGFDEDSSDDNAASDMRGIAVRQISGPGCALRLSGICE